jgi:DNA polymerase
VLAWLCKDTKTLGLLASGLDVYEAHARATMGYSDPRPLKEVNPGMRKLAKARILGLGYGCGKVKFQAVAKILANLDLTAQECEKTVNEFRAQNPKIVCFWGALENNLRTTLSTQGEKDAHFVLPSGRSVTYRNVNSSGEGLSVELPKNGKLVRLGIWGGVICENLTQAMARDVFMYHCLKLTQEGLAPVMRVHDEVVIEVDLDKAEATLKHVEELMSTPPEWASDLPLGAEAKISNVYTK